jgi:ATP-dependent protease ClpP protease subunit
MTTSYINFHAPVTPFTAQSLMAACCQVVVQGHTELYLMLSTPGGQVASGITLYNFLMSLPLKVTTHNIGNIDSIGNAFFLAGETRIACQHSTFMFHGVGFDVANQRFEEKNLREKLDSLLADQQRIGNIISARTNISADKVGELFREAKTKNADEALQSGIVHEICDLRIAPGSPILTPVFSA